MVPFQYISAYGAYKEQQWPTSTMFLYSEHTLKYCLKLTNGSKYRPWYFVDIFCPWGLILGLVPGCIPSSVYGYG